MTTAVRVTALALALAACGPTASSDAGGATSNASDGSASDTGVSATVTGAANPTTDSGPVASSTSTTTNPTTGDDTTGPPPPFEPDQCDNWIGDCNDGEDNDGDGLVDLADPECLSPCDNDEGMAGTYFIGDAADLCDQDCAFDNNFGMGDDHCHADLRCDPLEPLVDQQCGYDPMNPDCALPLDPQCLEVCLPRVPNGCDCYGCCDFGTPGLGPIFVGLLSPCDLDDPSTCTACTIDPSCADPCDQPCEVCVGQFAPPAGCEAAACDGDEVPCTIAPDGSHDCPDGSYCMTGCCLPEL